MICISRGSEVKLLQEAVCIVPGKCFVEILESVRVKGLLIEDSLGAPRSLNPTTWSLSLNYRRTAAADRLTEDVWWSTRQLGASPLANKDTHNPLNAERCIRSPWLISWVRSGLPFFFGPECTVGGGALCEHFERREFVGIGTLHSVGRRINDRSWRDRNTERSLISSYWTQRI